MARRTPSSEITRRGFCRLAGAGAASMAASAWGAQQGSRRPNVLLITTDDQGPDAGCYGNPYARTPHIDALADEGVRFARAYVTQASCSPSRSSILTGLYPHQNGQYGLAHYGYRMHEGIPTLQGMLKDAGYRNGIIGKLHVGPEDAFPFDYDKSDYVTGTRDVVQTAKYAEEFMDGGDGPFFLMVNYFDPHRPYDDGDQILGIPKEPLEPDDVEPFHYLGADSEALRDEAAAYYNGIARADHGVGLLMEALDKRGLAGDTLVIFVGDHGCPFTRAKTSCYEAGVRIPYVIRFPGAAKAGLACDELVSTVDIVPTVLEAAGIAAPRAFAGRSLMPLLRGQDAGWRETLCTEYHTHVVPHYFPRRTIRGKRYKLILNLLQDRPNPVVNVGSGAAWQAIQDDSLDGTPVREVHERYVNPPGVELYDLWVDPHEYRNLAERPAYQDVRARLTAELQAWREDTNDPFLNQDFLARMTARHDELREQKPYRWRPLDE